MDSLDSDAKLTRLIDYWAQAAKDDWETASSIYSKAKEYGAALFFLHLALEKILKARVVQHTQTHAPYSHNLIVLLEKAGITLPQDAIKLLSEINEFNMSGRYPMDRDAFKKRATKEFTDFYFQQGKQLWNLISQPCDQKP